MQQMQVLYHPDTLIFGLGSWQIGRQASHMPGACTLVELGNGDGQIHLHLACALRLGLYSFFYQ
jgi:hypothetical protein